MSEEIQELVDKIVEHRIPIRKLERMVIETALARYEKKPVTADALGMSLKTLYNKLAQYRDLTA